MSMHLVGPWLSTTGKRKSKRKFRTAAAAAAAQAKAKAKPKSSTTQEPVSKVPAKTKAPEKPEEPVYLGGQKLDPKNPKHAKIISMIKKPKVAAEQTGFGKFPVPSFLKRGI